MGASNLKLLSLIDLPDEINIRIFRLLDYYDLLAASCLSKTFHCIIKQYLGLELAMMAAGVINGSQVMDNGEKHTRLARAEEQWKVLDARPVKVHTPYSNRFAISAGFFVTANGLSNPSLLRYAELTRYEAGTNNLISMGMPVDPTGNSSSTVTTTTHKPMLKRLTSALVKRLSMVSLPSKTLIWYKDKELSDRQLDDNKHVKVEGTIMDICPCIEESDLIALAAVPGYVIKYSKNNC